MADPSISKIKENIERDCAILNELWNDCKDASDYSGAQDITYSNILSVYNEENNYSEIIADIYRVYRQWRQYYVLNYTNMGNINAEKCFNAPVRLYDIADVSITDRLPYIIVGREINSIYIILT